MKNELMVEEQFHRAMEDDPAPTFEEPRSSTQAASPHGSEEDMIRRRDGGA